MSVSVWQDETFLCNAEVKEFDVVIIGAGIAGLSSAYWLQKEDPSLKIALVDKSHVGFGASGRNAGFITCGSVEHFNRLVEKHGVAGALDIWKFSEKNLELLQKEIINQSVHELYYEQKGSFSLASSASEFTELKKSFEIMKEHSIDVEVINEDNIKSRLGAQGFVGGVKYSTDASINPMRLLQELKRKIQTSKNLTLLENAEVFNIESIGDDRLVSTRRGRLKAPVVILATNAYSPLLKKYFKDKIYPTRGQILATEPVEKFMEAPCYANFVLDYFRQLPTGEMIIGGFRQLQKDAEIGYSDETSEIIQSALEDFLNKHIPKVKNAKITHRWSGIMGFSSDGEPMIGSLPDDNQIFFLGGFTAHGLGLAFNSAKCLVDCIYGREIPKFISAKRF